MARRYRILDGHSFDLGAGRTAGPGEVIDLEDDVAAVHARSIVPAPEQDVQTSAPAAGAAAEA